MWRSMIERYGSGLVASYDRGSASLRRLVLPRPPAYISCVVESPPITFHGTYEDTTRAILSGWLQIHVVERPVVVTSFRATFSLHITNKKPRQNGCSECIHKTTELKCWTLLGAPAELPIGKHQFPFSELLESSLPLSTDTPLVSTSYILNAVAVIGKNRDPTLCHSAKFEQTIMVKRSIPEFLYMPRSMLCFDTGINIIAHHDPILYPSGTKRVKLQLSGLVSRNNVGAAVSRWRIRLIMWKLDENITTTFPGCDRHANLTVNQYQGEAIVRNHKRTLGYQCLPDGWKTDYSSTDGNAELAMKYGVVQKRHPSRQARYACDLNTNGHIDITHSLRICITMSRQSISQAKPHAAVRSGPTCVLSITLPVILTEPGDLTLSWESEVLPEYQDQSQSPPDYCTSRRLVM